jgi:hypothetical protein
MAPVCPFGPGPTIGAGAGSFKPAQDRRTSSPRGFCIRRTPDSNFGHKNSAKLSGAESACDMVFEAPVQFVRLVAVQVNSFTQRLSLGPSDVALWSGYGADHEPALLLEGSGVLRHRWSLQAATASPDGLRPLQLRSRRLKSASGKSNGSHGRPVIGDRIPYC